MQVTKNASKQRVHPLVVAFVVYHVFAITIYALPKPSPSVVAGRVEPRGSDIFLKWSDGVLKTSPIITGYVYPTGFWQYWDMFAPNPAQTDVWCDADITYFDGTTVHYQYPRMKLLDIPSKYMMERYRKFYERVNQSDPANRTDYGWLWPSFAHRIALLNTSDPKNPPVIVKLTRHWQDVARHEAQPGPEPEYKKYMYYTHVVDQRLLATQMRWPVGKR